MSHLHAFSSEPWAEVYPSQSDPSFWGFLLCHACEPGPRSRSVHELAKVADLTQSNFIPVLLLI